ncbi:MAG: VOC family protein [Chloroflexi bacterium CFX4]|nr:VOC family protein [Chloroflexi bacterium CFX4]MDL1921233.1 VOC family protein [Chloroflexi bacterium CFX3]
MPKIAPFLWFDTQAEEAMTFYTSLFDQAEIVSLTRYTEGPFAGKVLTGEFDLAGQRFMALDGGPAFKFTPALSFFVSCENAAEVERLWAGLVEGANILMPLDRYPHSEKFGWLEDKYGLSWQLNLGAGAKKIAPFLTFVGDQNGNAEEALRFYTSLFEGAQILHISHYAEGDHGTVGTLKYGLCSLADQTFMAIDSNLGHAFTFSEAISFQVLCGTQAEVDFLWEQLSAVPQAEQCGWLKDKYGISWQIIPTELPKLLTDSDPVKVQRVMQAMLQMKKIEVAALQSAYAG